MSIATASFDILVVADNLDAVGEGVSVPELHVFTYLACILSIYDGRSPDWWSYDFAGTKVGAPYSVTVAEANELLVANGQLARDGRVANITPDGRRYKETLSSFAIYEPRIPYLTAS